MSERRSHKARRNRLTAMRAAALAGLTALAPEAAGAEGVRVGAGEHGAYSRVVLNMTTPDGWRAEPTERGLVLRLPGVAAEFDAAAVTRTRKAHRVSGFDVAQGPDGAEIALSFTCDCVAETRRAPSGQLIIDVRDAPIGERRETIDTAAIETSQVRLDGAPTGVAQAVSRAAAAQAGGQPEAPLTVESARALEIANARQRLLEQLRRAADEGLIQFQDDAPAGLGDRQSAEAGTEDAAAPSEPRPDAMSRDAAQAPLANPAAQEPRAPEPGADQVETERAAAHASSRSPAAPPPAAAAAAPPAPVRERETQGAQAAAPLAEAAPEASTPPQPPQPPLAACLPDSDFNMADWSGDAPEETFWEDLTRLRSALYDELNRPDPTAVARLMEFYLGHKMPEEAAHTGRLFAPEHPRVVFLTHLADVVRGSAPTLASPLARPAPCPGRHGVWQAAALADINPQLSLEAFAASGRTLARTPNPFRRFLGARISRAAIAAGQTPLAAELMRLLQRGQAEPSTEMRFTLADIAMSEGRARAAQQELEPIMAARGPEAPQAALAYAATLEAPFDAAQAEAHLAALDGYAFQYRGAELGDALSAAAARLAYKFGDLTDALVAIRRAVAVNPSEKLDLLRVELIGEAVSALEERYTDPAAVALITALAKEDAADAGEVLRRRLTRVLIDNDASHLAPVVLSAATALSDDDTSALLSEAALTADLDRARPVRFDGRSALAEADSGTGAPALDDDAFRALRSAALGSYLAGDTELPAPIIAALEAKLAPAPPIAPEGPKGADAPEGPEGADAPATAPTARPDGARVRQASALKQIFEPPASVPGNGYEAIRFGRDLTRRLNNDIDLLKEIARGG